MTGKVLKSMVSLVIILWNGRCQKHGPLFVRFRYISNVDCSLLFSHLFICSTPIFFWVPIIGQTRNTTFGRNETCAELPIGMWPVSHTIPLFYFLVYMFMSLGHSVGKNSTTSPKQRNPKYTVLGSWHLTVIPWCESECSCN
jgi:hypothetical protein